ncbi:MAG: hypothetical protein RLY97_1819 [Pseudomonadota bacterium]
MGTLIAAIGLFALLAGLETVMPDRRARYDRWMVNLGWGAVTMVATRLASFMAPLTASVWAERHGFGVLNIVLLPGWAAALVAVIAMDCAVYWQHRVFHRIGWLWRWHRLHHRDEALDLSTAVRFHPVEGLISLVWKAACAAMLGAPAWAVPLFELWLMAGSQIEHSNVKLPFDLVLRRVIVTPAMHRVHHSAHGDDAGHNFGFAIAVWDRLFGSYRASPLGDTIGPPPQYPARKANS